MTESTKEKYIRQSANFLKQISTVFINEGYFGLAEQCKELAALANSIKAPSSTDAYFKNLQANLKTKADCDEFFRELSDVFIVKYGIGKGDNHG